MIVVIDYCVGNVRSVCNALDKIGCENMLSDKPEDINKADGVILPGVAAFGFAMNALGSETAQVLIETAKSGKPFLGICSGYQILFDSSTELGFHTGLSLIGGTVGKLTDDVVIPHMGWNKVSLPEDMDLFAGLGGEQFFYFAHSFCADVKDKQTKIASTEYGGHDIVASVQKDNLYGVQFHPEKSSTAGLNVLKNFDKICRG